MGIYEKAAFPLKLDQIFYHNFDSGYIVSGKEFNVALSGGFRRVKQCEASLWGEGAPEAGSAHGFRVKTRPKSDTETEMSTEN
jgi:hypothetical protein